MFTARCKAGVITMMASNPRSASPEKNRGTDHGGTARLRTSAKGLATNAGRKNHRAWGIASRATGAAEGETRGYRYCPRECRKPNLIDLPLNRGKSQPTKAE